MFTSLPSFLPSFLPLLVSLLLTLSTSFSSRYAQQNWLLGDHANAALFLRWHAPEGWGTARTQARYFRETKKEATKHTAVVNTRTGEYELLNYYGYALFFYHTISAFTGQNVHLPRRTLAFDPHPSAFGGAEGAAANVATLPVLLGGDMGTLTIGPTAATLRMPLLRSPEGLSFLNVTICQHVFEVRKGREGEAEEGGGAHVVTRDAPLVLALPAPCASAPAV